MARLTNGLGKRGSQNRAFGSTELEYTTDVGHDTRCRNYPCQRRGKQAVGRHNARSPDAKTGPHHHGKLETVLYVVKGRIRTRWGDQLESPMITVLRQLASDGFHDAAGHGGY
jgi:uncharacterized RmlC-like cupin family protein